MNAPNTAERQAKQLATVISELSNPEAIESLLANYGQMSLAFMYGKIENQRLKLELAQAENNRLKGLVSGLEKRIEEVESNLGKSKAFMLENRERIKKLEPQ